MDLFAAIDVGSNSVRLQVAAFISGFQHQVVHEERAVTRLGEAVFNGGDLSERAIKETVAVLKAFREKAEEYSVLALRAVGTSALRDAQNGGRFLKAARREAGVEVEVISGREEARLIHLGVISRLANPDERLLAIDIGGGSAEFTASRERRIEASVTLPLGAVRLTELFLESDPPAAGEIERLEEYVRNKLQRVRKALEGAGAWPLQRHGVIGTSGTMAALARAVNRLDAARSEVGGVSFESSEAEALYRRLRGMDLPARRALPGINARRAEIITAGAAVVTLAMRELGFQAITYSDAGLRDGVLVELATRHKGDPAGTQFLNSERLDAVRALAERYAYRRGHSEKVARLARQLFHQLQPLHGLADSYAELLDAAALLHDIGSYVNASKPHKHTWYLIFHSELPGYSERERALVAAVARYHRGSLPSESHGAFRALSRREQAAVEKLAPLLRLADACDSGRRAVHSLVTSHKSSRVEVTLLASEAAELEAWAAARCAPLFRKAFDAKLDIHVQQMKPVATP